jgi:chitin disaccharide deacetylase
VNAARRRLVINADDLGLTEGVNRGILEAHAAGAVSSTSMMVNMPGWGDALARLREERPPIGIGLHLNLVAGRPLTDAATLADPHTGEFRSLAALAWRAVTGRVRLAEVTAECNAQLDRLRSAGVTVTHVDSHRHSHCLPGLFRAVRAAAHSRGVRVIRVPRESMRVGERGPLVTLKKFALSAGVAISGAREPDVHAEFFGLSLQGSATFLAGILRRLDTLPATPSELVVHPGYDSAELRQLDSYTSVRERELQALTSPELRARLGRGDIELVTFASL